MNIATRLLLRDLKAYPARTLLAVLALVIGLWGVGSNLVSYLVLRNDLNENFLQTKPFHAALTSRDFTRLNLDLVRQNPEIERAELRDMHFLRVESNPGQWIPLWLFGVEDFSQFTMARIYPQQGAIIPPAGTMLLERNGLLVSTLRTGSTAHVRAGTRTLDVPVSGIVFDPAQAPATQDAFLYGYVDKKTYQALSDKAPNQRLIVRFRGTVSKQDVTTTTNRLRKELENQGFVIDAVTIPNPDQHPHQFQLNTLISFQGLIGLLAMIMGAVLIAQLMAAILARQTRQIGILKAIGATRGRIVTLYVLRVAILGGIATLLTLPIAIQSGYGFASLVAKILNFDILTTTLPWFLYALLAILGIALPVLVTLPVILRGTHICVREALADYGLSQVTQSPNGFRVVTKLSRRLSPMVQLALRNVGRNRRRVATTIAMIALGVAIFAAGFNVRQSLLDFLQESSDAMKYDVQVVLRQPIPSEAALEPFRALNGTLGVETWSGGQGRLQSGVVGTSSGIGVVALPYDTPLMTWDVIDGRWLQPSTELEVVVNQLAAEEYESVSIGQLLSFTVNGKEIQARLVGIVKEFNPPKIYIDKTQFDHYVNPDHYINSLVFSATNRDYDNVASIKKEIERVLAASKLDVLFVNSQLERAKIIFNHLNIILTLFTVLSLIVLMVAALGLASTTGINIVERTREIGVMRAIGAAPERIRSLFVAESVWINTVGVALGLLVSLPFSTVAARFFGNLILGNHVSLNFAFSIAGLVTTLVVTTLFSAMAARFATRGAIRISTREALSYE